MLRMSTLRGERLRLASSTRPLSSLECFCVNKSRRANSLPLCSSDTWMNWCVSKQQPERKGPTIWPGTTFRPASTRSTWLCRRSMNVRGHTIASIHVFVRNLWLLACSQVSHLVDRCVCWSRVSSQDQTTTPWSHDISAKFEMMFLMPSKKCWTSFCFKEFLSLMTVFLIKSVI